MEHGESEKVDLFELIRDCQISDADFLQNYLTEIWVDLTLRSKGKVKGIEKHIFAKYYEIPGILLERFFTVLDKDKDGILQKDEFITGMIKLFSQGSSFESLARFIFSFYDFDKDGKINKEDVRLVLSYVPIYSDNSNSLSNEKHENYQHIAESQSDLQNIINVAFKDKEEMDIDTFCDVIKNVNSDIFIHILMFLLSKRPFSKETILIYMASKNITPEAIKFKTPQLNPEQISPPSTNNKYISPGLKKKITQQRKSNKGNNILGNYAKNKNKAEKHDPENSKRPKRRRVTRIDAYANPTPSVNDSIVYSTVDAPKDIDLEDEVDEEKPVILYEGYIYKISGDKLKEVYFRLVGKDLYYYKNKEDQKHKGIHNLSGVFVKEGDDVIINDKKFYTIAIVFHQKEKLYYFDNADTRKAWVEKLKLAVEQKSLRDNYDIFRTIGKGKFGLVKYGVNKETKKPCAIKVLTKKHMDKSDLELSMTEINILKICQHPYTIKLYDTFETGDHIYIIMEYCKGGDLFSFIEDNDYNLPESVACQIIHQLVMAVQFIHSIGIIHRDLKPENILMTDNNPPEIRLLDFGLSKMIGPTEKCTDPYGTLSFVAPEVLLGKPYTKEVDLWSIGIITFLLLCGYLPFDDRKSEKEIARQTIKEPTPFEDNIWKKLSPEAKQFVDGLLQKDPNKRLKIDQAADHPWIKKFSKVPICKLNQKIKEVNS